MPVQPSTELEEVRRELLQRNRRFAAAVWAGAGLFSLAAAYLPPVTASTHAWLLAGAALAGALLTLLVPIPPGGADRLVAGFGLAGLALVTWGAGFSTGLRLELLPVYVAIAALGGLLGSRPAALAVAFGCVLAPLGLLLAKPDPTLARILMVQLPLQTLGAAANYRMVGQFAADRREKHRLGAVAEASRILTYLDPDRLLDVTTQHLMRVTGSTACVISRLDYDARELVNLVAKLDSNQYDPAEAEMVLRYRVPLGEGLTGAVAKSGVPILTGDAFRDPRAINVPGTAPEDTSVIAVPTMADGKVTGVIRISRPGLHQYNQDDLQLTQILANQVSAALENARLYQEARRMAVTDDLTGLGNARYLEARLVEEVARAYRYQRPVALVLVDSDSLKQVNDTYGHLQGNELLRSMAAAIRDSIRGTDVPCRYAGDEFVILMPETGTREATLVAERVRAAIESRGLDVDGRRVSVTASAGVASLPEHAKDAEELVRQADEAMYKAKEAGKNRVMSA